MNLLHEVPKEVNYNLHCNGEGFVGFAVTDQRCSSTCVATRFTDYGQLSALGHALCFGPGVTLCQCTRVPKIRSYYRTVFVRRGISKVYCRNCFEENAGY